MTEVTEAAEFPRWRRWTAGALIVISCVLVPLSVLAVWVRGQVLNTDRYVANITPLASNPAVIDTAATSLTNELFNNVDVKQIAEDALPPRARVPGVAARGGSEGCRRPRRGHDPVDGPVQEGVDRGEPGRARRDRARR